MGSKCVWKTLPPTSMDFSAALKLIKVRSIRTSWAILQMILALTPTNSLPWSAGTIITPNCISWLKLMQKITRLWLRMRKLRQSLSMLRTRWSCPYPSVWPSYIIGRWSKCYKSYSLETSTSISSDLYQSFMKKPTHSSFALGVSSSIYSTCATSRCKHSFKHLAWTFAASRPSSSNEKTMVTRCILHRHNLLMRT